MRAQMDMRCECGGGRRTGRIHLRVYVGCVSVLQPSSIPKMYRRRLLSRNDASGEDIAAGRSKIGLVVDVREQLVCHSDIHFGRQLQVSKLVKREE
jgi:hypothetical protein